MHSLERSTSTSAAHEPCDGPHSPPPTPPFVALNAAPRPPAPARAPTFPQLVFKLTQARATRLLALPSPSPSSSSLGAEPDPSFPALCAAAHALFGLAPSQSVRALLYEDEEGGVVTLSSTGELWALLALVRAGAGAGGGRAVRLRLVVEEKGQEEQERERREGMGRGAGVEVDGAPEAARAALDAPDDDDDDAAALSRAPSTRGRGMGSLRPAPAPPSSASSASERGASLGRSLVRRLSRRFSRRSLRGEGENAPLPPAPPLPHLAPSTTSSSSSRRGTPARPPLHARASTSALLPTPFAASPDPHPHPLRKRKSLAALANFLAPNRHVAPVSSSSWSSFSGAPDGASSTDRDADAPPPSYRSVVRMKEAQHARRLGRGLIIGACERAIRDGQGRYYCTRAAEGREGVSVRVRERGGNGYEGGGMRDEDEWGEGQQDEGGGILQCYERASSPSVLVAAPAAVGQARAARRKDAEEQARERGDREPRARLVADVDEAVDRAVAVQVAAHDGDEYEVEDHGGERGERREGGHEARAQEPEPVRARRDEEREER